MSPFPRSAGTGTVAAMPTQTDFDEAARTLRGTLATLATSRRHLGAAQANDSLSGGSIALLVDAALSVSQANVDDLAGRVESLASLCDQRARTCAEHSAALERWRVRSEQWERDMMRYRGSVDDPLRTIPWPGPAPVRPVAPYAWVEPS